jgi:hypothetical protein
MIKMISMCVPITFVPQAEPSEPKTPLKKIEPLANLTAAIPLL